MEKKGKMNIEEIGKDMEQNLEEHLEKQLERVNSWLSFAEAKNVGLIAANIAMLAVIIGLFQEEQVFCVVAGIITLISCAFCLISFMPNLSSEVLSRKKQKYDSQKEYNLIYYKDIDEIGNVKTYVELINKKYYEGKASVSNKAKDLAVEVMVNSQITMNKYTWFGYALKLDLLAIACVIILFIVA